MNKDRIIIGLGGHSNVLIDILNKNNIILDGYVDIKANNTTKLKYIGDDETFLRTHKPSDVNIYLGLSYLGKTINLLIREKIISKYYNYGFCFSPVISKTAIVSSSSNVSKFGVFVGINVIINANAIIGDNCLINTGVIIEHDVSIGNNTQIAPGSIILGGSKIGKNSFIGAGTVVRDSIHICDNVIIGAGTFVSKDIDKSGVYVGNPLRKIK